MNNTSYNTVHESSSNQHSASLADWMLAKGREPDPKSEDGTEQFLGKFLERKRSGRAKLYDSDAQILADRGFPNIFDRADQDAQQVRFAREVCEVLKANNGKIPNRKHGNEYQKKVANWIRNRRAAAHGVIHIAIPAGVLQVFKEYGYLHILHLPDVDG
jgi:hypothetical protein